MAAPLEAMQGVLPERPVMIFVGSYGSGKSEVAVNYALGLSNAGREVWIADLDIVNPYFRSREAKEPLEARGIKVVAPEGDVFFGDLPVMLPEIKGMISRPAGTSILDVGGDDAGARVLRTFAALFDQGACEVLQVVNTSRPFTADVAGIRRAIEEIEEAGKVGITGIVANTHLLEETTADIVQQGYEIVREAAKGAGVPVKFLAVEAHLVGSLDQERIDCPILPIERYLLPPFVRRIRKSPLYYL